MFRSLVLIASLVAAAYAYSTGAPVEVCSDMTPKHHVDPQTEPSPYTLTLSKSSIRAGDKVKLTLEGKKGEKFKGFLIKATTLAGNDTIGSFFVDPNDPKVRTIDCPGGKNNAATHKNSTDKAEVSFDWGVDGSSSPLTAVFLLTVVQNGSIFWVGQTSEQLTVHQ